LQPLEENAPKDVFDNSRGLTEENSLTLEKRKKRKNRRRRGGRGKRRRITYIKVEAMTNDAPITAGTSSHPDLVIVLKDGSKYEAELPNDKKAGEPYEIELSVQSNFQPSLVCTKRDIKEVYLEARGNDGWYIASIDTYTRTKKKRYTKLTADTGFDMWLDGDQESNYLYNAKKHLLTNAAAGPCITYIRVDAMTGDVPYAGSLIGNNHLIVLMLSNNDKLQAELKHPMEQDKPYTRELQFASRFNTAKCVSSSDIKEIHLQTQTGGMTVGT